MPLITDWPQNIEMRREGPNNRKLGWQRNDKGMGRQEKIKLKTPTKVTKRKGKYSSCNQTWIQEDGSTLCNTTILNTGFDFQPTAESIPFKIK